MTSINHGNYDGAEEEVRWVDGSHKHIQENTEPVRSHHVHNIYITNVLTLTQTTDIS